jgi:hypothetical protein
MKDKHGWNLELTVLGHGPSKLFIVSTGGRIDSVLAKLVLWVSARTWGRTRAYPQNIVTVATIVYFFGTMTNLWITHQYAGWEGALSLAVIVTVCVYLEYQSWAMRRLSKPLQDLDMWDLIAARRTASTRAIAGPVLAFSVLALGVDYSVHQLLDFLGFLGWMWALYTVTMGRSGVPPKKARRWFRVPSLPRILRPVPVSS